jgi:dihydrofolate reductase
MGKLVVTEFVTLDGVAQAPGGPDEDREGDFRQGGWQAPFMSDAAGEQIYAQAKDTDAMLLGRHTFEIFVDYWPTGPADSPFTDLFNRIPKYVASTTLTGSLPWDASVLDGDLVEALRAIKERHRHVHMWGSVGLFSTLLAERLVDRLHLWVHPVVLGNGKRLFGEGFAPTAFTLVESSVYDHGVALHTYEIAGDPTYGDMT